MAANNTRLACRGLTLTELLLALCIFAILAALSLPAWRAQALKAGRSEAMVLLMQAASKQELFRMDNNRYAATGELTLPPPAGLGLFSGGSDYLLAAESDAGGYRLTAAVNPAGSQKDDTNCWIFEIDQAGRRRAEDLNGADRTLVCWQN